MPKIESDAVDHLKRIDELQRKNALLEAQLNYYKSIIKQIGSSIEILGVMDNGLESNHLAKALILENDKLKKQLQLEKLTNREKEVLRYLTNGYTSKEIAIQLDISKLTVDTYRKHIQKKLKVSNIAQLVKLTLDGGGYS